jgi:PKD repeat protein
MIADLNAQTESVEWESGQDSITISLSSGLPIRAIWLPVMPDALPISFIDTATSTTFYIAYSRGGEIVDVPWQLAAGQFTIALTEVTITANEDIPANAWVFFSSAPWAPRKQEFITGPAPPSPGMTTLETTITIEIDGTSSMTWDGSCTVTIESTSTIDLAHNASAVLESNASLSVEGTCELSIAGTASPAYTTELFLNDGSLAISGISTLSMATASSPQTPASFVFEINQGGSLIVEGTSSVSVDGQTTLSAATVTYDGASVTAYGGLLPNFTSLVVGSTVNFTDTTYVDGSLGAEASWAWNFGDSMTSTEQNPSHTYGSGGTYDVELTVTTVGGGTGSCTYAVTVT